jgi:ParB family chromosome partitioning protein
MLEMALIENIQRENLNAIEIALSYQRLLTECNLKQEELGDRVGKKRTTVTNYLRLLLKLPPDIQIGLRDNEISMGHARALINIDNIDLQLEVYKKTVEEELSVRKVEELVRNLSKPKKETVDRADIPAEHEAELKKVETRLFSHFGTKIFVKTSPEGKGEIKIPFISTDDLNRILEILNY